MSSAEIAVPVPQPFIQADVITQLIRTKNVVQFNAAPLEETLNSIGTYIFVVFVVIQVLRRNSSTTREVLRRIVRSECDLEA